MRLSFSTANYVGRAAGYRMEPFAWSEAARLTTAHADAEFAAICRDIAAAGFQYIDLWHAHAWPLTLTPDQADDRLGSMRRAGLEPISYAGELGADAGAVLRAARLLGIGLVCGELTTSETRQLAAQARQRNIRIGIENYAEQHPDQIQARIGLDDDILGACVDTGAWLMQSYDPARAIRLLGSQVWHVHLKDVRSAGSDDQVRLGSGCLDLVAVLDALHAIDYSGALTIEQETGHADPTADIISAREVLERLLTT